MHRIWKIGLLCMMLSLASCNVTRYLSDEETLLNTVKVRTVGEYRDVNTANLRNYVRQTPNSRWFSFVKLPLYTYSIARQRHHPLAHPYAALHRRGTRGVRLAEGRTVAK